jgi:protein phosphatase
MNLIDFNKDVFSVTDVGLVRQVNEDNCYAAETPNGFLFIVCDGMGGHVGGARASSIAVNSMVNFFSKEYYATAGQALADALIFANKQILKFATEQPELKGMGTTACVLLIRDDKAWFAHIGDSRIYFFCNKQQQLYRLTKDHSVVQGLVDQGLISEAEAEHHPNKNRILKTLGIKKDVQPEICKMPVLPAKGDIFLICSDGLSGMVNDELLQHILGQKVSLPEKGENMLALAKQAGGTDNITLQLIHISNSPHTSSVFESKNSHYSGYTANNKNRGNAKLITIIALLAVILVCFTLIIINPFETKEKTKNIPQTNTNSEISKKKAWEKAVEGMRPLKDNHEKPEYKYYSKNGNTGVIVYGNDNYFVGTFIINNNTDGTTTYSEGEGDVYDANGIYILHVKL